MVRAKKVCALTAAVAVTGWVLGIAAMLGWLAYHPDTIAGIDVA